MNVTLVESDREDLMPIDRATTNCGCGYSVVNPNPAAGGIVGGLEANPVHPSPTRFIIQPCSIEAVLCVEQPC